LENEQTNERRDNLKERLIVQQLVDFIENKDSPSPIALISGMRKVGKTTVLKQLHEKYPDAVFIDMLESKNPFGELCERFIEQPSAKLLLVDEITYLNEYDDLVLQSLHDMAGSVDGWKYKCIFTGSSPAHMLKLFRYRLGGGRSNLFRLSPITFVEYLYITGRISSYDDLNSISSNDFADYLRLEGLPQELKIVFSREYFQSYYEEVDNANKNSRLNVSLVDIRSSELRALSDLLAYKLNEAISYAKMTSPNVGMQEYINATNAGAKLKWGSLDFSDALLSESISVHKTMSTQAKIRIIKFLLASGMALLEQTNDAISDPEDAYSILSVLSHVGTDADLKKLFENCSIHMITPLFYTRLGENIIRKMGIDLSYLYQNYLLGKMLEVYAKGSCSLASQSIALSSIKLKTADNLEVDVFEPLDMLLFEISISDKKLKNINVNKLFKEKVCLRICSTKTIEEFKYGMHRIPWPKLCALIDTGKMFEMEKTMISNYSAEI
jgi:hypothetical protein